MRILPKSARETKTEFLENWIFLKAGKAKTTIDSHHVQIAHAIKHYIKLGFDVTEVEDIENAVKNLRDTSIGQMNPNCYIQARSLLNIGDFINYSPIQIEQSSTITITKPTPQISMPLIPQSFWFVSIISSTGNTNKSNCYSAHDMLKKLNDMANKGELEFKIILRLETIQNWIASRYSSTCKCEMADIVLQREEQRH
ncbi:hypothetical protein GLOIN_2v1780400 [Rhizophagus irregularis DAOM 181602=DAOM 197198]|nr:hypothetical protein GLOIN_2v1780400 [Rhizophagus irregularis DAOM 181602=DAOM 197198]